MKINLDEVTLVLCITALIILTLGEPDILDGLIKMVNK